MYSSHKYAESSTMSFNKKPTEQLFNISSDISICAAKDRNVRLSASFIKWRIIGCILMLYFQTFALFINTCYLQTMT
jgi:hypothetical protein